MRHVNFDEGDSDHTSFNNHGYMGIYPFEDYQNYSPYIHTVNDLIGQSVNSFAMSQRYCQMNIGCLAEIATPVVAPPVVECNPVTNFQVLNIDAKGLAEVKMTWEAPEEGSTGELVYFDVYRDQEAIATVGSDVYQYVDSIPDGSQAEYFIMAVYSDGCEAPSQTETGYGYASLEEQDARVQIYPNPVDGELNIQAEGHQKVIVFNQLGQQIAMIETEESKQTLNLSHFPSGVYLLQIITQYGMTTKNIIVK